MHAERKPLGNGVISDQEWHMPPRGESRQRTLRGRIEAPAGGIIIREVCGALHRLASRRVAGSGRFFVESSDPMPHLGETLLFIDQNGHQAQLVVMTVHARSFDVRCQNPPASMLSARTADRPAKAMDGCNPQTPGREPPGKG
jgi:hypothetical protein